jgi:MFS family permease
MPRRRRAFTRDDDVNDPAAHVPPQAADIDEGEVGTAFERNLILWLTNISHAVNHFQNGMLSVLYVPIRRDLGFDYFEVGLFNAIRNILNSATQGLYGFLTPFFRRTRILAFGNIVMGAGVGLAGSAGSFESFAAARGLSAIGSSAQHPIGSSLLSGYFPKRRGTILALNSSISGIGGFVAPMAAAGMLYLLDWRQIFQVVALLSIAMGLAYLFFGNRVTSTERKAGTKRPTMAQGFASYRRVLRNRNMLVVASVMMVGAAGRGGGVNDTFLILHFVDDLGLSETMAAAVKTAQQFGGMAGPLIFGYISDRVSRKRVIQASLFLSALGTWWVAYQGAPLPLLFLALVVYGMFTHSRMSLTQALVADSIPDEDRDAAFSVFYFIGFFSVPLWGPFTGFLMQTVGFSVTFSVLAVTYLAGMLLMSFAVDTRGAKPTQTAP